MSEIDTVIRNGTVVDGTGAARFRADVAIAGDRIVALGGIGRAAGAREIDAAGQIVAPGFIDAHTHDDRALLSMPDMTPKVSQGVTSLVAAMVEAVKPNGGLHCAHHRNYFERLEAAIDEALAIGRQAQVPITISHHQCTGAANFGKAPQTLAVIDRVRRNQEIGLDAYPYAASSKTLDPGRA